MKPTILFTAVLILISMPLTSSGVMLGYVTGNEYYELTDEQQGFWMLGAIDGIIAESLSTDKDALGSWLGDCLKSFELPQTKAIFEKELKENPEEWHAPAAIILKSKFEEICGKE